MPLFIWCTSFIFPFQMNFPKFTFQLINYSYIFVCLFLGLCFLSVISHHLIVILRVYQVVLGVRIHLPMQEMQETWVRSLGQGHPFDPWVRKALWSRKWQPTPVFLPGKFHGQRSLASYSPWGHRIRHDWAHMHTSLK